MNAATATLPEQVELSVTRLAHVLFRGAGPGLSRSAASALHRIATAGPQRITELAAYESIAQPSATTLVGRLEGQGLVTRGQDPDDGRAVLVAITPAGQTLLDERRRARAATARRADRRARSGGARDAGRRRADPRAPRGGDRVNAGLLRQPKAVWAVAFAAVIAFMGIGLVDPILPVLAQDLDASPSQVTMLFTTYFAITGVAMLGTGFVASRVGAKRALLGGLALVIVFSALAGASDTVAQIAGFRAGWGLGNALFIATALSVIVGAASGGIGGAIMLYEAALGLGIASGPLLGGFLGGISWRSPSFGVAVLMSIAFVAIAVLLGRTPAPGAQGLPRRPDQGAAPPRAARGRLRRAVLQLRLLHAAGLHAVPAAPRRARLLRLLAGACSWRSSPSGSRRPRSAGSAPSGRSAWRSPPSPPSCW